jgi:hypothetical protein
MAAMGHGCMHACLVCMTAAMNMYTFERHPSRPAEVIAGGR